MTSELIKLFAPWLYIAVWALFALRTRSFYLIGGALLLASYVAFSQNFSLAYRELHQIIQLILMASLCISLAQHKRLGKFNFLFFGVFISILVSILFSVFDEDARVQTINFFVMIAMVNFLYFSIRQENGLHQLLIFFARLSVIAAVVGIAEYIFTQAARIETTMANSNYYAYFLGIGFCVAYDKYHGASRLIISLLVITAIVMSGSRAALAFPAIHLLTSFILSNTTWSKKIFSLLTLFLVTFSIFLSGSSRFSSADVDGSDAERLIFARIALAMANDHPLTGIGWGRFPSEFSNYASGVEQIIVDSGGVIDASTQDRRVTHNDLMRILAELGWPAAFASLWVCFLSLRKAYFFSHTHNPYLFSCLAGTLLFSLTHNNLNSVLFWFFLSLPFVLESMQSSKRVKIAETSIKASS